MVSPSSLKYLVNMSKYKYSSTKEIIGKFADDFLFFSVLCFHFGDF